MKKLVELAFVSIISVLVTLSVVNTTPAVIDGGTAYGCSTQDITNMYADYIDQWKKEISVCFDTAEEEVFDNNPIPDIIGPNPDVNLNQDKGLLTNVPASSSNKPCSSASCKSALKSFSLGILNMSDIDYASCGRTNCT